MKNKKIKRFINHLIDKIADFTEDIEDKRAIRKTDFGKGTSFEEFEKELNLK